MKRFATIVALGSLVLLAVFLLYPLALVLDASIRIDGTGAFTFANYTAIVKSRYYLGSIGNSLLAAALATGLACAIGIPLAFCLARIELPGRALLLTLASLPLVLPSFVSAYALVLLFGHAGVITTALRGIGIPIGSIYGMPGIVIVSLLPFAAVLMVSVLRFRGPVLTWELGLDNYATLLSGSYRPLLNTLTLASLAAVATMLIGAPIGYVVARHRSRLSGLLDFVGMVPFAVSGTILAIGLIVAFNSGPLVLTGGWLILVIAYVVRKLPFAVRSSSAIVHQLDPSLEEASINLGVSPAATFATLTVPLMASGLVGGLVLVWITAASELSATVVLYSSRWATTTVVMYHAIEGTGAGLAAAAAAVLILVTAIPLLLINRRVNKQEATVI